jgi:hypothetical protein
MGLTGEGIEGLLKWVAQGFVFGMTGWRADAGWGLCWDFKIDIEDGRGVEVE